MFCFYHLSGKIIALDLTSIFQWSFFLHFTCVALTQKNQDNSKKKFANHCDCDATEGVKSGLLIPPPMETLFM